LVLEDVKLYFTWHFEPSQIAGERENTIKTKIKTKKITIFVIESNCIIF